MTFDDRTVTGQWDYRTLPPNIQVGNDCWFERQDSFARYRSEKDPGLIFGDRVRVYTWTTFNVEPTGCVEIGDDAVLVGPVFMCAEHIKLGRNVTISYHVTLADSDFHPIDPRLRIEDSIANSPQGDRSRRPAIVSRPITIDDDVWIGIGAIVLKGVHIGRGARVAAGAVVTRDVPDGEVVAGNPAQPTSNIGLSL
jgi:acetyltransferase-like isoleucine patch superfamily enzyme